MVDTAPKPIKEQDLAEKILNLWEKQTRQQSKIFIQESLTYLEHIQHTTNPYATTNIPPTKPPAQKK